MSSHIQIEEKTEDIRKERPDKHDGTSGYQWMLDKFMYKIFHYIGKSADEIPLDKKHSQK